MLALIGNAVVGQSGGPTAAINATLAGVIRGAIDARDSGVIGTLYGMRNGIEGFLGERIIDLFDAFDTEEKLKLLERTPAAALGSCRRRLKGHLEDAATYSKILEILKKYNIRYFFYIGGNDSMDTVLKLSDYAKDNGYEIKVVGVPKTIDNDLPVTDHTPGFGSAAKFIATTVKEILRDVAVYTIPAVTIVEIMGRDAGWLTASAALAGQNDGIGPDLIYLPERAFDVDAFIKDVKDRLSIHPAVLVCASEGIRTADGEYLGAKGGTLDAFGHKQLSGAGKVLEGIVKAEIGCKVRSIELNLPQRCASHIASLTDLTESDLVGRGAVAAALSGKTGVMMTFIREGGEEYSVSVGSADIGGIANGVKGVPAEYINESGNYVTDDCVEYLRPLIVGEAMPYFENGVPKHIIL
ncbi:MAG: 6-phosphofructokinase [Clostridia bacterium]|nr:6-phosphofructokinase [Clostridia bacterium]